MQNSVIAFGRRRHRNAGPSGRPKAGYPHRAVMSEEQYPENTQKNDLVPLYEMRNGRPVATGETATRGDAHEGLLLHPVARLTVTAIINGELHLVYKQYPPTHRSSANLLCEPAGGHVDVNETPRAAMVRETIEELFAEKAPDMDYLQNQMRYVGHFIEGKRHGPHTGKPQHIVLQYFTHLDEHPFEAFTFDPKETSALVVIPARDALRLFTEPGFNGRYPALRHNGSRYVHGSLFVDIGSFRTKGRENKHGLATLELAAQSLSKEIEESAFHEAFFKRFRGNVAQIEALLSAQQKEPPGLQQAI